MSMSDKMVTAEAVELYGIADPDNELFIEVSEYYPEIRKAPGGNWVKAFVWVPEAGNELEPSKHLTCYRCISASSCPDAWDEYNTDGECLDLK